MGLLDLWKTWGIGRTPTSDKSNSRVIEPPQDMEGDKGIPVALWHINGRNRYANDERYRELVDEAKTVMLSSVV